MADLKELVDLLSRGGPAEGFQAASQGFAQGRQAQLADQETRRKRLLDEVSRLTGSEVNKIVGQDVVRPGLSVPTTELSGLAALRDKLNPKATPDTSEQDAATLALTKARTAAAIQSARSSQKAREQADKRLQQIEEAPQRAARQKALKDLQDAEAASPKLMAAINSVRAAAAALPESKPGLFNQGLAKAKLGVKKAAKDPAVEKYLGIVAQNLAPLARGLAEEKGPLTDRDIERIERGLGELTTPVATREALLQELIEKVNRSVQVRRDRLAGNVSPEPAAQQAADLSGVSDEDLFQMLMGGQ